MKEPNFFCMVCKVKRPAEKDSTCCTTCDVKKSLFPMTMKLPKVNDTLESCPTTEGTIQTVHAKKRPFSEMSAAMPSFNLAVVTPPQTNTSNVKSKLQINIQNKMNAAANNTPQPVALSRSVVKSPLYMDSPSTSSSIPSPTPPVQGMKTDSIVPDTYATGGNSSNPYGLSSEDNCMIDNLPAIENTGYNELGPITRKEYACPKCSNTFSTRHNLKRHYMIHVGIKPFSCPTCRKPFREMSTMKKHMLTHTKPRAYKCILCQAKFEDYLEYTNHKATAHPDEHFFDDDEDVINIAKRSKNSALTSYYDDSYEDDSNGEQWLECCECNERFTDIDLYTEHIKIHESSQFLIS